MGNRQDIRDQFYSYLQGTADARIIEGLFTYFATDQSKVHLSELVNEAFEDQTDADPALLAKVVPITDRVGMKLAEQVRPTDQRRMLWKQGYTIIAIAATILLAIASFLYLKNTSMQMEMQQHIFALDAAPGTNRATLKLSDGRVIDLSSAANGSISDRNGMQISKTADGQLDYQGAEKGTALTNTVTTPNGGQYQVRLPDGTKVWLNAASSISYATDLSISNKRIVYLSGEAYFEVAHDRARPFIVDTKEQQIEVLGTHFNVNSYADEGRTTTTLSEGSVKVTRDQQHVTLKPGQQATGEGSSLQVMPADMETALAWKNGNLAFKSAPLEQIMRQVQRWYDVEVVYQGKVRHRVFSGGIPRSSKLSVLLKVLSDSGVKFEMKETPQGKTLVIHE
ncbi:FecR family protein [Pedobacter chitinilyticus]|uniref:DUF4974 domain-containing protein n=1 Tax=Pedobacter chitinilyticus TaxID=2233776 RepID=A0A443YVW1_9SPHI|nr:FecR family protein [Pedobacter chitinilyticus]RWU08142.1 DUF4974 domain-containing protein [Pedobacter chitinilyticus]